MKTQIVGLSVLLSALAVFPQGNPPNGQNGLLLVTVTDGSLIWGKVPQKPVQASPSLSSIKLPPLPSSPGTSVLSPELKIEMKVYSLDFLNTNAPAKPAQSFAKTNAASAKPIL